MKRLIFLYRHNIYGIIGTLFFHILLLLVLLLAEVRQKGEIREHAMEIEIPVELIHDAEELLALMDQLKAQEANVPQTDGDLYQGTNLASNRSELAASDRFFDETYNKELAAAKELAREVDEQLSKAPVDPESIQMPEDVTEGKSSEEISNVVFTGESNIEYHLTGRYHLRLPIPVYLARGGGEVVVDITVNRQGRVVSAKPRQTRAINDEQIYLYSRIAAQRTVFNADENAPALQSGTIRYTFIPQ